MAIAPLKLVSSPAARKGKEASPLPRPAPRAVEPPSEEYLAEPVPLADYDRATRAAVARASRGIAWPSLLSAWADWFWHLAAAPGKQMELASKAQRKASRFAMYAMESLQGETAPCIEPLPQDRRFADPGWQQPPCVPGVALPLSHPPTLQEILEHPDHAGVAEAGHADPMPLSRPPTPISSGLAPATPRPAAPRSAASACGSRSTRERRGRTWV